MPFDIFLFQKIKYLTFNRPRTESMPYYTREASSSPGYFTDFLRMLRSMELSDLESIIINDFVDFPRKTNLIQIILLIEKNHETLKKVVLGNCFSDDDISLIKDRLKPYRNIRIFVLQKQEPEAVLEMGFPGKKTLYFFNKSPSQDSQTTLSNFNNSNFWQ